MSLSFNKAGLYVKLETVSGTPETVAAGDLLTIYEPNFSPEFTFQESPIVRPYFGNGPQFLTKQQASITFKVPKYTSGALGVAPNYGKLFRMAEMLETIVATTSVKYKPLAIGTGPTGTAVFFIDGVKHTIAGAKCTLGWSFAAEQSPAWEFTLTGTYGPVVDAVAPGGTAVFTNIPPVGKVNTTGLILGYAACVESFTGSLGNVLTFADRVNCATTQLTDRKVTNKYEMEMTNVATKDWFGAITSQAQGVTQIQHGTVPGSIVKLSFPIDTINSPSYSNKNGALMFSADSRPLPNIGNDEIEIAFL